MAATSNSTLVSREPIVPVEPDRRARSWSRRHHPIAAMILRRTLAGVATLFVASVLIFAALNILPGDAASVALGRSPTPATVAKVRAELGSDKPLPQRYGDWIGGIVRGDLGKSTIAVAQNAQTQSVSA